MTCSSVDYYGNGAPAFCMLAESAVVSGQEFASGTGLHFTTTGVLDWCFLPRDTEIQGVPCRGDGHAFMTEFHPNGKLKRAYLAENRIIDGVPCAKFRFWSAVFWPIHGRKGGTDFHSNGKLRACELSESTTVGGRLLNRKTVVHFNVEGKLVNSR
jgi:hypothetical protein